MYFLYLGAKQLVFKVTTAAIRDLLEQARLETAIREMSELTRASPLADESVLIANAYHAYRNKQIRGLLDEGESNKAFATITSRLLDLLRAYDHQLGDGAVAGNPTPATLNGASVFISYAWGGESELITNEIDVSLQGRGVKIVRDKRDLGFTGSIRAFMQDLGRSKGVIIVMSDRYLRSKNCLFELLHIAQNGSFADRVFPIILEDANIFDPLGLIGYVAFWEQKISELNTAMRTVNAANLQGIREEIDLYTEIRAFLPRLTNVLQDMNTLTPEMHKRSNFGELYGALLAKLAG